MPFLRPHRVRRLLPAPSQRRTTDAGGRREERKTVPRTDDDVEGDERRRLRSAESPMSMLPPPHSQAGEREDEGGPAAAALHPSLGGEPNPSTPVAAVGGRRRWRWSLPRLAAEEPRRPPEREIILVQIHATPLTPSASSSWVGGGSSPRAGEGREWDPGRPCSPWMRRRVRCASRRAAAGGL
jgi:hypothetical protein